jgi:hypothetical protein
VSGEIVNPREHKRDRKAEDDCDNDQTHRPVWNIEDRKNLRHALGQRPARHDVGKRDAIDFSSLQLGEKFPQVHGDE